MNHNSTSFESGITRLEQIVRLLEKGDVPLEESVKLFQEGTELVRSCGKLLDDAKLQVNQILADDSGAPVEEVFINESQI